jgi:hypothetical protein
MPLTYVQPMAQNPFDQLSKSYLEDFLAPFGQVICNLEIPGEAKFVDVYFAPNPDITIAPDLGLLGRILQTPCSLEPFRNPPTRTEIRTCLLKLIWLQEEERRKTKQQDRKLSEDQLPQLWVLASGVSKPVLEDFGAQPDLQWPEGVYRLPKALKTSLVAIDELPLTPDTLWLRILGKGVTQEQAIREVVALPASHPCRNGILRLLASWRVRIDLGELQTLQDQEMIMALPQAFLDWEQQTQERGREEGCEEGRLVAQRSLLLLLLDQKFGPLPEQLRKAVSLLKSPSLEALALEFLKLETIANLLSWLTNMLRSQLVQEWGDRFGELPTGGLAQLDGASLGQLVVAQQGEAIATIEQGLAVLQGAERAEEVD